MNFHTFLTKGEEEWPNVPLNPPMDVCHILDYVISNYVKMTIYCFWRFLLIEKNNTRFFKLLVGGCGGAAPAAEKISAFFWLEKQNCVLVLIFLYHVSGKEFRSKLSLLDLRVQFREAERGRSSPRHSTVFKTHKSKSQCSKN